MAQVRVRVLGALNKPFGKDDLLFEASEPCTVEALLLQLGYKQNHLRFILAAINGQQAKLGDAVKDRDEIELATPASGG